MQIFKNARFISCEDTNRVFAYLVEENGKIVFAGNRLPDIYSQSTDSQIKSVDLNGKCVVPAFGDTHIHFGSFAYFNSGLDCRDAENFDEMSRMIRQYIGENPKEKVVFGFGCSAHTVEEKRLPQKDDLDKITSHPLMIIKYDGHAAVGNSALIKKLPSSISKEPGCDKTTGWFHHNAFYKAVNHITRAISLPRLFKNLIAGSDYLARQGISLIHTVEGVGFPLDLDVDIMRFASRGLPQTIRTYFQTMDVKKVLRRNLPCIGGCFATALDGCFGSEDAALTLPYSNNLKNFGTLFYSQSEVNDFVKKANRSGLQVALHAIGDAAVEQALIAFETALDDYPRNDHRHIIIHGVMMNEEKIEKAAKLGIDIAIQTPFLYWKQEPLSYLEQILGDRIKSLFPLKSMIDKGLRPANGSDGPASIPNPIEGIYAACNHPDPDESISVIDALRMHTNWCARLSFDEKQCGTLTEGKTADFVVLNQNPLDMPVKKLMDLKIENLYLKGEKYTGQKDRNSMSLFIDSLKNRYPSLL